MKKISIFILFTVLALACGQNGEKQNAPSKTKKEKPVKDNGKGIGEITEVKLNSPLNQDMIDRGRAIYDMKCAACHKLKGQRVVGPSWVGLTEKRKPEWIMNMITNVEVMLDKDPTAQKLLEECLTRMPNQNVSVGDARDILEFMYQNEVDNSK